MNMMTDTVNRSSTPRSECPSQDILLEYLLGMADDFVSVSIDTHIATCDPCNQRMTELESTHGSLLRETLQDPSLHDASDPAPAEAQQAIDAAWRALQRRLREDLSTGASPVSVGQYRILERIGCGGMGIVYRAEHSQLKKVVALKLIPIEWSPPQTLQRFEREIRAAGRLQHPGIVTATDAGTQSGMQYLAMEFVDGLDLGKLTRSISPIPTADACEIARQLSLALAHAHQLGIIHRDIKPSNVMLDRAGQVKLLDFGLVHFHRWDGPVGELTTVGQFLGTLDYMAPEQAERSEVVDARSDLYSLGATLFKLLTGQTPLAMTPHQSPIEKLKRLSQHQPIQLQTLRPDLPSKLCDVVNRLLATQPDARLPSALHVAEALQPFCESSDLTGLATRGLQSDNACVIDAVREATAIRLPNPLPKSAPSDSTPQSTARRPPPVWAWIALAALPLFGFFGWRILLESDQGNLVIESASDTTKIEIKRRAGGATQEMLVEPGTQLTRLKTGDYDITIHEGSDQVSIEPKRVQLRRGETVIARIVQSTKNESQSTLSGTMGTGSSVIPKALERLSFSGVSLPESVETTLFKGKPLIEWLRVLERERDATAWREAFDALNSAEPQLIQCLAEPIRSIGLKNNFFRGSWFIAVFSHEEFDQFMTEAMQGMPPKDCLGYLDRVLGLSDRKMRDGKDFQASQLTNTLRFVEEQISQSDLTELRQYLGDLRQHLTPLKDHTILAPYPWLQLLYEGVPQPIFLGRVSAESIKRIETFLSDPKLDLDKFLFLAGSIGQLSDLAEDKLEIFRLHVRNRLDTELRRWAESGEVLGGFGMGVNIIYPSNDGISFGGNDLNKVGGLRGMGGFGGNANISQAVLRTERGLQLLALCSRIPREQRPLEAIDQLATMMRSVAENEMESGSLREISWHQVYTFNSEFLGEAVILGDRKLFDNERGVGNRETTGYRNLTETEIARGFRRWLSQLRFGDMESPNDVAKAFWFALQNPTERDPLTWVIESGRDQKEKIDRLRQALPDSIVDLKLDVHSTKQSNEVNVLQGGLILGPGMSAGQEFVEITLKLEPDGWRVASFEYGANLIEF